MEPNPYADAAQAIIDLLTNRKGLDAEWDAIAQDIQDEIRDAVETKLREITGGSLRPLEGTISPTSWECVIGEVPRESLDAAGGGSDLPMRRAVAAEYRRITGCEPDFIFSGWNARLSEIQRAVHEDREPDFSPPGS